MKLFIYQIIKPLRKQERTMIMIGFFVYIGLLVALSGYFTDAYFLLNEAVNYTYYVEQSTYIIWLMIGMVIIIRFFQTLPNYELFLGLHMKFKYLLASILSYYMTILSILFLLLGLQKLGAYLFFDQFIRHNDLTMYLNAMVFASFMLLWVRLRSKLLFLLGMLIIILQPVLLQDMMLFQFVLPYMMIYSMGWHIHMLWIVLLYSITAMVLYQQKSK